MVHYCHTCSFCQLKLTRRSTLCSIVTTLYFFCVRWVNKQTRIWIFLDWIILLKRHARINGDQWCRSQMRKRWLFLLYCDDQCHSCPQPILSKLVPYKTSASWVFLAMHIIKALASMVINDSTKNHRDLPERWSFHFWSKNNCERFE